MKSAHTGRGLRVTSALLGVGLLAAAISMIGGSSAHAAAGPSNACVTKAPGAGHFSGVISAVPVDARCVSNTSDGANGLPPLIWHGGPVMGTENTGPIVVTPIFWNPTGHTMTTSYKSIIGNYLSDVATDSGANTNVYSTMNEYDGSNGTISYDVRLGTPLEDTRPLPANGCNLTSRDRSGIYADGTGYDACLDDAQVA